MATVAAGALAAACFGAATAADPAVSEINGKVTGFGGASSGDGVAGVAATVTAPVGHSFGVQFDGVAASVGGDAFLGGAGHFFWRDPNRAMFGLFGSASHLDQVGGVSVYRLGLEGQYFIGNVTLDGYAGARFGDVSTEGYGGASVDYYPTPNLMLSAGGKYDGRGYGVAEAEYQFGQLGFGGASAFARGTLHDADNYTALAGVRLYLGGPSERSLIDRHRREDPDFGFESDLSTALERAGEIRQAKLGGTPVSGDVCQVQDEVALVESGPDCVCPDDTENAGSPPTPIVVNFNPPGLPEDLQTGYFCNPSFADR